MKYFSFDTGVRRVVHPTLSCRTFDQLVVSAFSYSVVEKWSIKFGKEHNYGANANGSLDVAQLLTGAG